MASDDAAVVVTLRANLKDYESALKNAVRATERAASQAEKAISSVGKGGGASNVIQANFQKSAGAIANDARVLQFQLNDIFSGLASGQGIRAVQQQLGQIAQQLGGGGLAAGARTMGAAMVGMINPINLAVVAFGVLASVAASYFSDTEEEAKKAQQALKEQAAMLRRIADAWGDSLPEVAKLADQLERIAALNDAVAGTAAVIAEAYKPAQKVLDELAAAEADVVTQLDDDKVIKFTQAWGDLVAAVKAHKATAEDVKKVQDVLFAAGTTDAKALAKALEPVASMFDTISAKARKASEDLRQMVVWSKEFQGPPMPGTLDLPSKVDALPERRVDPYFDDPDKAGTKAGKAAGEAFTKATEETISKYARDVIGAESGGDRRAKNPASSATGLGQFISSTWLSLFKQEFPDAARTMTNAQILAYRENGEVSVKLIEAYGRQNAQLLEQAGLAVNEAALHLAHFLGPGGAIAVLKAAPGTPVSRILGADQIRANPTILGGGATREDVMRYAERRVSGSAASKIADDWSEVGGSAESAKAGVDAFNKSQELAKQRADQFASVTQGFFGTLTNDLMAGKDASEAFRDAIGQLTQQLLSLAMNSIIQQFFNNLFGVTSGSGFPAAPILAGGGGLYHGGGTVGLSGRHDGRSFSPALWAGAPRYAAGGIAGLRPGEIPAILHRGEIVVPNARRLAGSGAGRGVQNNYSMDNAKISVDMSGSGYVAANSDAARQFGQNVQKIIQAEMVVQSRPGGLLRKVPR